MFTGEVAQSFRRSLHPAARSTGSRARAGNAPDDPHLPGVLRTKSAETIRTSKGEITMNCTLPGGPSLVDAHFECSISPARERTLRSHLPNCASCREYYEKYLLLSQLDPKAKTPEARLATGLGIGANRTSLRAAPMAVALCAAAALALPIVPLRSRNADE